MTNEISQARHHIDGVPVFCAFDKIVDIAELKENPQNPNIHSKEQIELLAEVIKKTGWRAPITISNLSGFIVKGHGRLQAAKKAGFKEVPVECQNFNDQEEEMAALLADNKIAELAEIDTEKLTEIFKDYEFEDLSLTGYSQEEFDELVGVFEEAELLGDADEVPEEVETRCKLGDVWQLGNHRLMCGDSTCFADVEKLMDGAKADITFTSPPYNGDNEVSNGNIFAKKGKQRLYNNGYKDNLNSVQYIDFCKKVLNICFICTSQFIFWNVNYNAKSKFEYIKQIEDKLPYLIEQICWKKTSTIPLKGMLRRAWEPIYVFSITSKNLPLDNVESNLWEISNTNSQVGDHKACFPIELPAKAIKLTNAGLIFEPFGGSGSTLIACEQLNCKCYVMELDPHYCDVIITRWETLTGNKAVLLNK